MEKLKELWQQNKVFRFSVLGVLVVALVYYLMTTLFEPKVKDPKRRSRSSVQTNILDTKQIDKLSESEAKDVYKTMVLENKQTLDEARTEREKAQKARDDQKADSDRLRGELNAMKEAMARNGTANSQSSRSLDPTDRVRKNDTQTSNAYQPAAITQSNNSGYVKDSYGVIEPQRIQPMRTITQKSIKTAGDNGIIEVTPILENHIRTAKEAPANYVGKSKQDNTGTKPVDSKARHSARKNEQFLPATSVITGVLINGLEAQTSLSSKQEPMPVTMRVKKDVILPNNYTMDLRDCNLIGAATGDLASQRAYIRATALSCVNSKGQAFEVNIEAYAVSEYDGKNGIKGTLISRNGNAIFGSAVAGGLAAVAGAVSPSKVNSLDINPNSQAQYQTPNVGAMGMLAGAGAASAGLNKIVDYYASIADAQWPIVEISPGRPITFIVQKGTSIPTQLITK